jgi:hypothetical protein
MESAAGHVSALGQRRTSRDVSATSGLLPKADTVCALMSTRPALRVSPAVGCRGSCQPLRIAAFDPIQNPGSHRSERRKIVGEQYQSKRQHPESQDREEAEKTAADEKPARRYSYPARGRLPEPADGRAKAARQPVDELIETPIVTTGRGRLKLGIDATSIRRLLHRVRSPFRWINSIRFSTKSISVARYHLDTSSLRGR